MTITNSSRYQAAPYRSGIATLPTARAESLPRLSLLSGAGQHAAPVRFGAHGKSDPFTALREKGYTIQTLKPTEPEALEKVIDLIERVFDGLPRDKTRQQYTETFQSYLDNNALTYVVRKGEQMVGTATMLSNGFIFSVGVDKAHGGQGMASAMMRGLLAEAKKRVLSTAKLQVKRENAQAIHIYKKQGFIPMHQAWHSEETMIKPFTWTQWLWCHLKSGFNWLLSQAGAWLMKLLTPKAPKSLSTQTEMV